KRRNPSLPLTSFGRYRSTPSLCFLQQANDMLLEQNGIFSRNFAVEFSLHPAEYPRLLPIALPSVHSIETEACPIAERAAVHLHSVHRDAFSIICIYGIFPYSAF